MYAENYKNLPPPIIPLPLMDNLFPQPVILPFPSLILLSTAEEDTTSAATCCASLQ